MDTEKVDLNRRDLLPTDHRYARHGRDDPAEPPVALLTHAEMILSLPPRRSESPLEKVNLWTGKER